MIRTAKRVALYARFSSDNQRSESIDAQVRAMEAYCKQRHYVIVNTYIDEAKSATTDRRPAFQEMIADSRNHSFDILLVHKLDRFARNRYDSAVYKRELKKNGVAVYSVLENLDDSPESIIMEAVLEGMSEYYSQNLAREVMKGMRETALQGKHTGGKPPLGYDVDEQKKLVINPQEAKVVKLIFSMYGNGEGYSAILKKLHDEGYKTKRGEEFRKNSLYSILANQKYSGKFVFNRSAAKDYDGKRNTHQDKNADDMIIIEGGCPQIIDTKTFEKVQARMQENRHAGARNNAKTNYLLSGRVYCKECGRAMIGNARKGGRDKKPYITYRCPNKSYICTNREINRDFLEQYVIMVLEKQIFNRSALKAIAKRIEKKTYEQEKKGKENLGKLQEELEKVEAAIKNIADAVAAGLMSDGLVARLEELEQEKTACEERIRKAENPPSKVDIDTQTILAEYLAVRKAPASPAYKEYIRGFIDEISVGKYAVTIKLKTGLEVLDELDTTLTVGRQEIYARGKAG